MRGRSSPKTRRGLQSSHTPARKGQPDRALAGRLRFESFLLELSAAFVQVRPGGTDELIDVWLGKLARFMHVDRSSLWELAMDGETVHRRYVYSVPGLESVPAAVPRTEYAWLTARYRRGDIVVWSRIPEDIPEAAAAERAHALRVGVKSVLSIPMIAGSSICVMAFASVRKQRAWPRALIQRLRLVAEIFASAVARQRMETSLQSSEARTRAILQAQPDLLFVLSPEGVYLECHGGDGSDLLMPVDQFLGRNVTDILPADLAEMFHTAFARASQAGEVVALEYTLPIRGEPRAYEARVVRRDDGALVIIVRNVTEHKKAQMEIERLRLELTHFGRVALTAQLTASLAHELLQPITAVLGNAEAGQRMLESGADQRQETQAIFASIIESGNRAADVVGRVRGFLRKERNRHRRLDLNRLVREVAAVTHSDLLLRQVQLATQLDAALPEINGDPVELQQVILNLLINGADSLGATLPGQRELVVSTAHHGREIELTVRDRGTGADPAHLARMFEPFFTTKPDGMGMGLPICAEIVRAHGGRLWAENNENGGMTMHCRLPLP